jgi:hypothetical protein
MLPRFERRFQQLQCPLGDIAVHIARKKRSVFDPELGTPLVFDPATGEWSYRQLTGRTSRRTNLQTRLELQRQGIALQGSDADQ